MSIAEIISLGLGGVSVGLGVCAMRQAKRYKNLGDKLDKDRELIIQAIHEKAVYTAVEIRHINEMVTATPNKLNLHKDKLYVHKNSNYKLSRASEVIDKLNKELPKVLKQTYIDSIMAAINLDDGDSEDIGIVTLRHEYGEDDIKKIKELNNIFYEDGIFFEIDMS